MKVHVQFIEVTNRLRFVHYKEILSDEEFDLTSGTGLPLKGDIVWLYDQLHKRKRQFWVIERHWNIGNVIGMLLIYLSGTSEGAKVV